MPVFSSLKKSSSSSRCEESLRSTAGAAADKFVAATPTGALRSEPKDPPKGVGSSATPSVLLPGLFGREGSSIDALWSPTAIARSGSRAEPSLDVDSSESVEYALSSLPFTASPAVSAAEPAGPVTPVLLGRSRSSRMSSMSAMVW
jgi:hypothetical protein